MAGSRSPSSEVSTPSPVRSSSRWVPISVSVYLPWHCTTHLPWFQEYTWTMLIIRVINPCRHNLYLNIFRILVHLSLSELVYWFKAVIVEICVISIIPDVYRLLELRPIAEHYKIRVHILSIVQFMSCASRIISPCIPLDMMSTRWRLRVSAHLQCTCKVHQFPESIILYCRILIQFHEPLTWPICPIAIIIIRVHQVLHSDVVTAFLTAHLRSIFIYHIIYIYRRSVLHHLPSKTEVNMLRLMVDVKLTIQKQFQLFKELRQRPVRQSRSKVMSVPCIRQSITYNKVFKVSILNRREVPRIPDGVTYSLQYIEQIRLERNLFSHILPVIYLRTRRNILHLILQISRRVVHPRQRYIVIIGIRS